MTIKQIKKVTGFDHTVLSYYKFRQIVEKISVLGNEDHIVEDVGHIILSHHGLKSAMVKPMTLEAKVVAMSDGFDAETNYIEHQLEHSADDKGWFYDTLNSQFFFKRRVELLTRKRKMIK